MSYYNDADDIPTVAVFSTLEKLKKWIENHWDEYAHEDNNNVPLPYTGKWERNRLSLDTEDEYWFEIEEMEVL